MADRDDDSPAASEVAQAEAQLIARLRARDEIAFTEFVRAHQTRVFQLVFRMLGNRAEAEEMTQEVFLTVFKSIDSFRGDSKLSTWLYRITANHCKNRIKYLGRRARGSKELDEAAEKGAVESASMETSARIERPDEAVLGRETENVVQNALAKLDEEHRTLIVLRDLEGMTYEEIQAVTGLAEGTVKSRLHRARLALKEHVEAAYARPARVAREPEPTSTVEPKIKGTGSR